MYPTILTLLFISQTKKKIWSFIRNPSWQWRTFLTPEMEISNPKWFQCNVLDHIFHLEKDWNLFLHPALRYKLVNVEKYKVWDTIMSWCWPLIIDFLGLCPTWHWKNVFLKKKYVFIKDFNYFFTVVFNPSLLK